jgi:hypothetical protein
MGCSTSSTDHLEAKIMPHNAEHDHHTATALANIQVRRTTEDAARQRERHRGERQRERATEAEK